MKDPCSNTSQRPGSVCLRPWDEEVWGDQFHVAKVNLCNKAREYLNLNNDSTQIEEESCYPQRRPKAICVDKHEKKTQQTLKIMWAK